MVVLFLIFCRTSTLLSIEAALLCVPTNSAQVVQFLHILANTCLLFFTNSHPDRCEVISHCGFDLHFPDD